MFVNKKKKEGGVGGEGRIAVGECVNLLKIALFKFN